MFDPHLGSNRRVPSFILLAGLLATCLSSGCGRRPSGSSSIGPGARPTPVDLLTDDRGQLRTEFWESHRFRGAKVGHRQTRIFELPETEPPQLRIVVVDRLEMKRFGDVTEQQLTMVSLETEKGQVMQWTYRLQSEDGPRAPAPGKRVDGVIHDGRLELTAPRCRSSDVTRVRVAGGQSRVLRGGTLTAKTADETR